MNLVVVLFVNLLVVLFVKFVVVLFVNLVIVLNSDKSQYAVIVGVSYYDKKVSYLCNLYTQFIIS